MKRAVFTLFFLAAVTFTFGQNVTYVTQNAWSAVPPTGWTISAQAGNWSSSATANAGGTSPEAKFYYSPTFTGVSRLVSPTVNTTGETTLVLNFKHMLDHYSGAYTIGAATSTDGTTWTDVWTVVNPTTDLTQEKTIIINNAHVGSATFRFCIYFNGYSYNLDNWYVDDVNLYSVHALDGKIASISVADYVAQGNVTIGASLSNVGSTSITAATVNYSIDGGAPVTQNLTGLSLALGASSPFTFTTPWNATAGNHTLKVWISDVNGGGLDDSQANDTLTKTISVATQSVTRFPVFEEFTSSTCAPCASFNSSTFTPFITAHSTEFSLIKYQMNWPSPGDPYYTAEGGARRGFYGVNAVPDLFVDGAGSSMTASGMLAELNAEAAKPTYFTITTTPTYTGTTVSVPVTIDPYISGTFKVVTVVVEKTTTGNVSSNGETSFKHVMMKMFPDGNGANVSFTAGTPWTQTYTQDMSTTNMEEMTDLQVVVMVQSSATKEIFQSADEDIILAGVSENGFDNLAIYPNPATSFVNIFNAEGSELQVYDVFGKVVFSASNIEASYKVNTADFAAGAYVIKLTREGNTTSKRIAVVK